jgi:hypothetical protein
MAVTNEQVASYLANNPGLSDAQIAQTMAEFNVTPAQMAAVTGIPESQVAARVAAVAPTVTAPTASSAAPAPMSTPASAAPVNTWNYDDYVNALRTGGDLGEQVQRLATQNPTLASNTANLFGEIIDQQNRGSSQFWYQGNTASPQAAAADFALRLAENGISSLSQLGQLTIPSDGEQPAQQVTINKLTGEPLPRPELLGRGTRGLDIDYNLTFAADGTVIPFTSNRESSWMSFRENALKPAAAFALATVGAPLIGATVAPGLAAATQGAIGGAIAGGGAAALTGGNVLQGALLGGVGGYASAGGFGGGAQAPGLGPQTDASFLAADAAQLAAQGFNEATIAQVLGASGYASGPAASLAASMAVNGLDVGMMTQQLDALSTNTGLMSQTGSSADFLAADALQLQGQLGNNFAAIEQNLIASGVDPLIAADISQQLAFNPGLTQTDLATNLANSFGNNIYDVNMAQTYPTSVLPGAGGLLSDVITDTAAGTSAGTSAGAGLTAGQVGNLINTGLTLAGTVGVANAAGGGGTGSSFQAPTQTAPTNDPNYYNQLQQYYNAYMPQTPRDVVSPLQQWYEGSFGNTGTRTVAPQQSQTAMPLAFANPSETAMPAAVSRPTTSMPVAPTPVQTAPVAPAAPSIANQAQQQLQALLASPNLQNIPQSAQAAISAAINSPRNYNDVVASGGTNTLDVSSLSPEIQRAYDIYQQSMILGANRDVAENVYKKAGVNPTNPDAFFSNLGLLTGTPTQTALAQYAPVALERFANSGGGALTFTVDPSTVPTDYQKPNIPMSNFNMGLFTSNIMNSDKIPDSQKQKYITETAQKYGFNPADFI